MGHKDLVTAAVMVLAILATVFASDTFAQDSAAQREDQLKAAYLFNFLKFIEWPSGVSRSGLTICFVGARGVHEAISIGIENKRVGQRRLYTRVLEPSSTLVAAGCHVLYLESVTMGSRLRMSVDEPLLTVSDAPQFTRNGGMIELFTESNRLRFRVNVDNAHRAGLRISSSLLQLAADVKQGGSQ